VDDLYVGMKVLLLCKGKEKGKFSLCLIKCATMKKYPVLHEALCHEDVWGSEGVAPRILNLSTR